jgi:hypothetical protein
MIGAATEPTGPSGGLALMRENPIKDNRQGREAARSLFWPIPLDTAPLGMERCRRGDASNITAGLKASNANRPSAKVERCRCGKGN